MNILGIETSCDETAVAIVKDGHTVVRKALATSLLVHVPTGGIIPENAARKQLEYMLPVLSQVTDTEGSEIDAIAVTVGPGLIGSLLVGVETAKTLATLWNKPIIPVNHLIAHLYANWIDNTPEFPAIGFVVSGGHTDLILMKDHTDIHYIGGTRDDAAGEAFDKIARTLGLGYPGGPAVSQAAEQCTTPFSDLKIFPRPMIDDTSYDFSFSGLKTAVINAVKKGPFDQTHFAAEAQAAIVETLVKKSTRAVEEYKPKSFLLAGGVAANKLLRQELAHALEGLTTLFIPPFELCTDNAVTVATAAFFHRHGLPPAQVNANPELTILSLPHK